jgi:hypothetical protein
MSGFTRRDVQRCQGFLRKRMPDQTFDLVGSYRSYITGLKFHPNAEKPSYGRIYICMPDFNNAFDKNAIGVHANIERIGYLPKELAAHIRGNIDPDQTVVLAFCTGRTTKVSSQCCYHLFQLAPASPETEQAKDKQAEPCVLCREQVAALVNLPCQHVQYCSSCVAKTEPDVCTQCRKIIETFEQRA